MIPDFPLGETVDFKFTTRQFSDGVPTTLAGTPAVEIYEDNSITQITAAETLTVDFDGVAGLNNLRVVCTSGNGFESGKSYAAVISAGTVGGTSVIGEVVAQWTIERAPALRPTTAGRTLDVETTGEAGVNLDNTVGTLDAAQIGTAAITAAKFGAGAIDAAAVATDAIGSAEFAQAAADKVWASATRNLTALGFVLDATDLAADTIGSSEFAQAAADKVWASAARTLTALGFNLANTDFAANAIDAAALASDAVSEIRQLASGTSDAGGSTTTMVDAARTEADDVWNGAWILFTSGALANQCRLVTDFDAATDTATFAPAVTASVGAGFTYEILPAAAVDVQSWLGTATALVAPNALVSGRMDSSVGAMAANVITAAAINAAAITAAKFGANAVDAAALATDAVNEIRDAILSDSTAFAGANVDATISSRAAASVLGALADAAAAGDPTVSDTVVAYVKQLINTLEGAAGIPVYPASADPANNVSLAESIRAIRDDVTGLAGSAMRGTDSAALASVCTEARLAELDAANLPTDVANRATPAQVNTEVSDVLKTDTIAELGVGAPAATPTIENAIMLLYMALRNRRDTTATTDDIRNSAGTAIASSTLSDDTVTFSKSAYS